MLLQYDLNKWWLTQWTKIYTLYINVAPTGILQIYKIYYIEKNIY